ncbi:nucleotidyltransferase domain-containing protein [Niabella insulamsoli]|uniref:nucleotidyltransferase domain-containing protein n=1 Tax=Niabella insulamsoli TaxID=3144874 RepID=UPI0031FC3A41
MIAIKNIIENYGSEMALVLLCSRVYFGTETNSAVKQLIDESNIDWNHVMALANYHRIEPIIYKVLTDEIMPQDIALKIRQRQHFLIQQSFKRAVEAERLIHLFASHRIKCVPYKGSLLSKLLYGDIVSRESSDIDLVIDPKDFEKVLALMKKEGFLFESQLEYNFYKKDLYKKKKDVSFNKYEGGLRIFHIEFHWQITDRANQIDDRIGSLLYQTYTRDSIVKKEIDVLEVNAHLTAVFVHHAMNDGLSILRNLIDIGRMSKADNPAIDFRIIQNNLSRFHLKKAMAVCSFLSDQLLGVALPFTETDLSLKPQIKSFFINQMMKKDEIGKRFETALFYKSNLFLKDTAYEKVKYLLANVRLRFIPSRKDIRIFRLPKSMWVCYIFLKPFRSLLNPADNLEEKEIAKRQQ